MQCESCGGSIEPHEQKFRDGRHVFCSAYCVREHGISLPIMEGAMLEAQSLTGLFRATRGLDGAKPEYPTKPLISA